MVVVEYHRPNGDKIRCTYMHLTSRNVEKGDTVNHGDVVGITGNTGHSHGAHLHFEVSINGKKTDPVPYVAELGIRGGFDPKLIYTKTGQDLAASAKTGMGVVGTQSQQFGLTQLSNSTNPNDWMSYIMQQNDESLFQGSDLLGCIFTAVFTTFKTLAVTVAAQQMQEQLEQAQQAPTANENLSNNLDNRQTASVTREAKDLQHQASVDFENKQQKTSQSQQRQLT